MAATSRTDTGQLRNQMDSILLETRSLTRRFPGVVALKEVNFSLRAGEIHALCGENGAGKSTLIKVLSGIHPAGSYEGELLVDGNTVEFGSPAEAEHAGIAVIYQELALVDEMTVGENIFLGSEPRAAGGLIEWPALYHQARLLLEKFKVDIDPNGLVATLGIGRKQLIEIVKALSKESRILILDEPTAALAEHEIRILLDILRDLRSGGIAIVYISHKLDEVFAIADRITVLRDGSSIITLETAEADRDEIIRHMVGREITGLFPERTSRLGPVMLEVEDLDVADPHSGDQILFGISFSLRAGEVLGIGGLMGAGRTELLMHLFGAWGKRLGGSVRLDDQELPAGKPNAVVRRGLALLSEDRRRFGLIPDNTIGFNLSLSSLPAFTGNCLIDQGREFERNDHFLRTLRVRAFDLEALVGKLSGGNQQKVVLGRALMTKPLVIFLDEPTRGIEVGAKQEIYEIIGRLTQSGKAVVLVSSELPELMGLSDRILILHEGRIAGEFDRAEATQERLLSAAMGAGISNQ